jgi:DNA-binding transcriptional MerR regulator
MESDFRIADVARRSGFSAPTLRYYEHLGLLTSPARTEAGYRSYDESVLTRLAFIARAKALGCTLEEIAALMPEWEGGRCAPIQDRLRGLAAAKLGDAQSRIAELLAFTADLRSILATLGSHTPEGACDSQCGCVGDPSDVSGEQEPAEAPPVVCTLEAGALGGRLQEWQALLAHVTRRTAIEDGVRLELDASAPLDELVRLVRAEHTCCEFFALAITADSRGMALEVRAPAQAQPVISSLFGVAV